MIMNNGQIRNIIWDWNGTLLNDMNICIDIMNTMLANRAIPLITADLYREVFTFPVRDYMVSIGFDFSKEPFNTPADEFVIQYDTKYKEAGLFSGVRTSLRRFRTEGYRQYILSAQEQTLLSRTVCHYELTGYFEALTGTADNYAFSKIETGRQMMKDLGLVRSETIMVGDTVHDFEVASSMGIRCLLVSHGHQSPARLRATGAPVVDSLSEIPLHLGTGSALTRPGTGQASPGSSG
jgi:phosphoglycolate phosphatase